MRRGLLVLAMLFGVFGAGTAAAQISDPHVIPQTSPVLLGTVVGTDNHSVTMETPDGDHLVLEFDSHTVMPYRLDDGTRVRAEFTLMNSGLRRAGRITPLTAGSTDMALLEDELGEAAQLAANERVNQQRESREVETVGGAAGGTVGATYHGDTDANHDANHNELRDVDRDDADHDGDRDDHDAMAANHDQDDNGRGDNDTNRDNQLPQTGSVQPLLLAAGLVALGGALGMRWGSRQRFR